MSAQNLVAQLQEMIDEVDRTKTILDQVEKHLESLEGGAVLIGLMDSQNMMASGVVQVVEAAKQNRETLGRFLFNIRERLRIYKDVLG